MPSLQPRFGNARADSLAQNLMFELREHRKQPGHRAVGCCGQIERFSERYETDAQFGEFLQRHDQIDERPAPSVQSPDQHHIDLAPTRGCKQILAEFALCRARPDLFDLNRDRLAAFGRILPHGAYPQRQSLLVVRGHARAQPDAEHFRQRLSLTENLLRFRCCCWPFGAHLEKLVPQGFKLTFPAR